MKKIVTLLLGAVALLLAAFLIGHQYGKRGVEIRTVTIFDTIFYERPQPVKTTDRTISVNMPKWLFADRQDMVADSVANMQYNTGNMNRPEADSLPVQIVERTVEYRDSLYYLRIAGPVVGNASPRLEYAEIYAQRTTQTQIMRERPKWEVGAEIAANLRNRYLGAYVARNFGRFSLEATAGYDPHLREPLLGVRGRVAIWQPSSKK